MVFIRYSSDGVDVWVITTTLVAVHPSLIALELFRCEGGVVSDFG